MAQVDLTILKPANDAVFLAADHIEFVGRASVAPDLSGVQLHYRWYASLWQLAKDAQGNVSQFSLNPVALTDAGTPLLSRLPMGSHVITFAASDQPLESNLKDSLHGGVDGGVNRQGLGHVIHVLKANIVAPTGPAPINASSSTPFQVEAPWPWDDVEQYKLVNGLHFSWLFVAMSGDQPDPSRQNLTVHQDRMTFKKSPPILELNPETYQHLHGRYRATLRVEAGTPPTMTSDSITVEFP